VGPEGKNWDGDCPFGRYRPAFESRIGVALSPSPGGIKGFLPGVIANYWDSTRVGKEVSPTRFLRA